VNVYIVAEHLGLCTDLRRVITIDVHCRSVTGIRRMQNASVAESGNGGETEVSVNLTYARQRYLPKGHVAAEGWETMDRHKIVRFSIGIL
jgi:hypothetical protein